MVPLVDRMLGPKFLKKIQCHYDSKGDENVEMTLEKLHLLVTSIVEPTQKIT
jgi:hypothetical protein